MSQVGPQSLLQFRRWSQTYLWMYVYAHGSCAHTLTMKCCYQVTYHRVWGEKSSGDSVEVGESELDACVGESQLMYVGGGVPGADVALPREWRHGDGVFQLILRQVVWDASVHISLSDKRWTLASEKKKCRSLNAQPLNHFWQSFDVIGGHLAREQLSPPMIIMTSYPAYWLMCVF